MQRSHFSVAVSSLASLLFLADGRAVAQVPESRVLHHGHEVFVFADGKLSLLRYQQQIETGIAHPQDLFVDPSRTFLLLCGTRADNAGGIEMYTDRGTSYRLADSISWPNRMPVGIHFDASVGKLQLLFSDSHTVEVGTWNPWLPLGRVEWSVVVSDHDVPALANATSLELAPPPSDWEVFIEVAHGDLHFGTVMKGCTPHVVTSRWPLATRGALIDRRSLRESAASLSVYGPSGEMVEVVDMKTSEVLGSAVPERGRAEVALSKPLVIGRFYGARIAGEAVARRARDLCTLRVGVAETIDGKIDTGPMPTPVNAWIGNDIFAFRGWLAGSGTAKASRESAKMESAKIDGYFLVAARNEEGRDPIVAVDGRRVLRTPFAFPVTGYTGNGGNTVTVDVPIPDDPMLEGAVVLGQFWWCTSSASVAVSEIVGAEIHAAPRKGNQAVASPPALAASGSVRTRAEATAQWLERFAQSKSGWRRDLFDLYFK